MFESVLIANRGEIACRVMRTAKRMGLRTIAVYSDADRNALHVREADQAVWIGPAPALKSYLLMDRIIEAAEQCGAQAVHPGYGFLAESAGFATACKAAGLAFIGPPAEAIRAMGQKDEAKRLMEAAGVPVLPGYHGMAQDAEALGRAAGEIGYPIIIKPVAGGGGKGMRIVSDTHEFQSALEGTRREAESAFGDERVLLEKYLIQPRHIEVQIFADSHGNVVHLFDRDCSIQRRHQKVVEEAPAPGLTDALRVDMSAAAVNATTAITYKGAGTVEFLLEEPNTFYFMEMNTRLQVEHPVTEMVTGVDLVEWQLRIAAGEKLPAKQGDIGITGHAMEVRIYAEDPEREFLPQAGRLHRLRFPLSQAHVRIETGVTEGDRVSVHYDPMIAKLVAWGEDRSEASKRLRSALAETLIAGPADNLSFLAAILTQFDFVEARIDTGFIDRHISALIPDAGPADESVLALATLAEILTVDAGRSDDVAASDPYSPWRQRSGWRPNRSVPREFRFRDGDRPVTVCVSQNGAGFMLAYNGARITASAKLDDDGLLAAVLDGRSVDAIILRRDRRRYVLSDGKCHRLMIDDPLARIGVVTAIGNFAAPMPGRITAVHVSRGERVKAGQRLIALEAMKMEHVISAPSDGIIKDICYAVGDQVAEGTTLVEFDEEADQ
jgi:3-methylcrotonyl-CoA carboxylase alpha subunit